MTAKKNTSLWAQHKITGAIFIAAALAITIFNNSVRKQGKEIPSKIESPTVKQVEPIKTKSVQQHDQKSRIRLQSRHDDSSIANTLDHMLSQEDFPGIVSHLEALSNSGSLNSIENLLKRWCHSGTGDLAQWALAYSKDSDPKLYLKLCAEALSNPNQQIRETSAAELEVTSGIFFSNTPEARSWLESLEKN